MSDTEKSNFVLTLPLLTTPRDESALSVRFEAARQAYNMLLAECLRRSRLMRESRAWRSARKLPKGKEKTTTYRELNKKFGFREYDLYAYIQTMRAGVPFHSAETKADTNARVKGHKGYIGEHLDAHTVMAMGKRAIAAVERAIFKGGRSRFSRRDEFRSVQGINDQSAINWTGSAATWSGLRLQAVIDDADPVVMHGIQSRVKLTRIVRMVIRGRTRYFVQLTCEGSAYRKADHKPADGVVGIDVGPSTIAIVGERSATLERFCEELADTEQCIAKLQRSESRARFLNNPDNFATGTKTVKKCARRWMISKRQRRLAKHRSELQRRERAHRKQLHGRLVHRVLATGNDVRAEKLSYRSFQRNFGRSVRTRAPGMFIARLKAEAAKWGATVTEFETRNTMLSQTCLCGTLRKKKLSERWHECACGVSAQRDVLSAHLARHVQDGRLDINQAERAWPRLCNAVVTQAVSSDTNGATNGASALILPYRKKGQSPSPAKHCQTAVSALDVVAGRKVQARAGEKRHEGDERAFVSNANREQSRLAVTVDAELETKLLRGLRKKSREPRQQQELW